MMSRHRGAKQSRR